MAEAIVSYVLSKLADALINKAQELKDVREQIEQMQQELRLIHALLRDANSKRNTNELVTEWLNQVKEIGDKINSVIDTFRVNIEQTRPESSHWFKKQMTAVKRSYKTYKHGMRKELEGITQSLNRILKRGIQLGIQGKIDALDALDDVDDLDPSDKVDDPEVVGLQDDKAKIIKQLLDSKISRRTVLSIVGTGGLGKTTLAQKVYKRYVYGSKNIYLPLKWDQHTNLQTVKNVLMKKETIADLGCCINFRTLGIYFDMDQDFLWKPKKEWPSLKERVNKKWQNLKDVLRSSEQLVYLSITVSPGDQLLPFGGTKDLPCHGKIQKLHLDGVWDRNICVPSVEMFPTNLTKLTLIGSRFHEDPMSILERLQSLSILNLTFHSYVGTEMICSTGGFPKLKKLKLLYLENLRHWDIKEGAMPILTHLKIYDCEMLHALPELQKVWTLQELLVWRPSRELRESMQGKDLHKFEHIPSVSIRQPPTLRSYGKIQEDMA